MMRTVILSVGIVLAGMFSEKIIAYLIYLSQNTYFVIVSEFQLNVYMPNMKYLL